MVDDVLGPAHATAPRRTTLFRACCLNKEQHLAADRQFNAPADRCSSTRSCGAWRARPVKVQLRFPEHDQPLRYMSAEL